MNKIGHCELTETQIGGKAFNLNFLQQKSINVPNGIILTVEDFHQFKNTKEFDLQLKKEIANFIDQSPAKSFMVRSSAVGEDGNASSFAGLLESYQVQKDIENVIERVQDCWLSAESKRVLTYQEKQNKSLKGVGVVIQELIDPDYAGVLFTTSPLDAEKVLIEYVEGHAEKLVQGEVTPESISIEKTIKEIDSPFNVKELLCVSNDVLNLYDGVPQDIEWVCKDNKIYIVQSRPITTLKKKVKWSNTNVNENYPDKLSPLLYSIARRSYYHYFKNLALQLGAIDKKESHHEGEFSNIIGLWGHRMYYNMTSIHHVLGLTPFKGLFKSSFDDFVGYQDKKSLADNLNKKFTSLRFITKLLYHFFKLPNRVAFIESTVSHYAQLQYQSETLPELFKRHHEFLNIRFNLWMNASFSDLFAMLTHGVLGKFCKSIDGQKGVGYQNGLIQAIPGLVSNKPILEVWNIYSLIKEKGLLNWFESLPAEDIWKQLESKDQEVYLMIHDYLKAYGFRCSGELTLFSKNYIENPASFIEMLKLYAQTAQENPQILFEKKEIEQKKLLKEVASKIRLSTFNIFYSTFKIICLKLIVKLTAYAISCRERVRLKQAQLYYHFKSSTLKLAAILVEKDFLDTVDDIFYLEYDEISRILSGEETQKTYLKKLVQLRKDRLESASEKDENFSTHLGDFSFSQIFEQDQSLQEIENGYVGLPACGGVITAQVKVLNSIHEIKKLNKGDILVTQQTDPGWVYAFPLISGLIVERGGMLSHGAIVAREFGIPAVVGVKDITNQLVDGQKVRLDGNKGIIECL